MPDLDLSSGRQRTAGLHGSPRYAHELDLPGLRCWPLRRCPYLIFYVERDDHVDAWRLLQGQRDIPQWMQDPIV